MSWRSTNTTGVNRSKTDSSTDIHSVFTKQGVAQWHWLQRFSDARTKGRCVFVCSEELSGCCAQLSYALSFVPKWRRHTLHHILNQFIARRHISAHRTTEGRNTQSPVAAVADTYVTLARRDVERNLESGQGMSVPERARGHCTALPVTTSSTNHGALGSWWLHVQTVPPVGPEQCTVMDSHRGVTQGSAWLATLKSVQVHLCPRYPLHLAQY